MRNVTIRLDEDALRWARHKALDRDMSVSRFVGALLEEEMRREQAPTPPGLERWRELVKEPWPIDASQRMTREEAHERKR